MGTCVDPIILAKIRYSRKIHGQIRIQRAHLRGLGVRFRTAGREEKGMGGHTPVGRSSPFEAPDELARAGATRPVVVSGSPRPRERRERLERERERKRESFQQRPTSFVTLMREQQKREQKAQFGQARPLNFFLYIYFITILKNIWSAANFAKIYICRCGSRRAHGFRDITSWHTAVGAARSGPVPLTSRATTLCP
jgi:hypothetical protein